MPPVSLRLLAYAAAAAAVLAGASASHTTNITMTTSNTFCQLTANGQCISTTGVGGNPYNSYRNYGTYETCSFRVEESGYMRGTVASEQNFDYVTINGLRYSGQISVNQRVEVGDTIQWVTDGSDVGPTTANYSGFSLCLFNASTNTTDHCDDVGITSSDDCHAACATGRVDPRSTYNFSASTYNDIPFFKYQACICDTGSSDVTICENDPHLGALAGIIVACCCICGCICFGVFYLMSAKKKKAQDSAPAQEPNSPPQYTPPAEVKQPQYPPQQQQGYPPQEQPGYPPQQPQYPPQQQPGYPPQEQPGYPTQQPQYPPQQQQVYPPQQPQYPPQQLQYPPQQQQGYPPQQQFTRTSTV